MSNTNEKAAMEAAKQKAYDGVKDGHFGCFESTVRCVYDHPKIFKGGFEAGWNAANQHAREMDVAKNVPLERFLEVIDGTQAGFLSVEFGLLKYHIIHKAKGTYILCNAGDYQITEIPFGTLTEVFEYIADGENVPDNHLTAADEPQVVASVCNYCGRERSEHSRLGFCPDVGFENEPQPDHIPDITEMVQQRRKGYQESDYWRENCLTCGHLRRDHDDGEGQYCNLLDCDCPKFVDREISEAEG
jgi:hypothetical protein